MDNFDTRKWFKKQYLEEARIREFDNDDVDRLMVSLLRIVLDMKSNLQTIKSELEAEPELDFKVRDVEMLLRTLNHDLDVLREKLSY